jgi:hypothetical protein
MEIFTSILANGDKIGSFTLLLLVFAAVIWGQSTDRLIIGSQVKENKDALKEAKKALDAANIELQDKKLELIKLQLERELFWHNNPQLSQDQSAQTTTPQKGTT